VHGYEHTPVQLQVVETRLFSEGLHVLGQAPAPDKLGQYLEAYFGKGLSPEAVDVVSHSNGESLDAIKAKLQRIYSQVKNGPAYIPSSLSQHPFVHHHRYQHLY